MADKKYLFVSYGHSVQIDCTPKESDVNVTLYIKRFNRQLTKVNIDNVKWSQRKGIFTMTATQPLDGGEYICKTINKTGYERITTQITVIPVVAPTNGKLKKLYSICQAVYL